MITKHTPFASVSLVLLGFISAVSLQASTFVISSNSTTAQTLSANGETGTVNAGKSLTLGGSTVDVTMSATTTLTNNGTIQQTGTGRAIDSTVNNSSLTITNTGTISSVSTDAVRVNAANTAISLTNSGTISVSAGGQAIDWAAITTAANSLTNQLGGIISTVGEDAVRPGANGTVINAGSITATPTGTTSPTGSDGIQANGSGVTVTNTGSISGRHGITGGFAGFSIAVNNNAGTISAVNGSGLNIDDLASTANVSNAFGATIKGGVLAAATDGDGDGVDVDGTLTLNNSGNILGLGARGTNNAEGVAAGGGSITNTSTGQIIGSSLLADAPNGDTSRGGNGILIDDSNGGNAIAATTVTNSGLIQGKSGFGIKLIGAFADTITNNATGTIRGAGATAGAAIQTGDGGDTLNNSGTIIGDNGLAIDLGAGNDSLNITGGSITGNIDGGTGTNTATLNPGAGNTFSYAGALSNFSSVDISTGHVILSGASTYSGNTTVSGNLTVTNATGSATGTGSVIVNSGGILNGTGHVGDVSLANGGTLAPGLSPGTLNIDGNLSLVDGAHLAFELGGTSDLLNIGGALNFTGGGTAIFDITDTGSLTSGVDYTLMNYASASGLSLANLAFGSTPAGFAGGFTIGANSLTLHVDAAPEPSRALLGVAGLAFVALRRRRSRALTA
jgi:hypothetical protein